MTNNILYIKASNTSSTNRATVNYQNESQAHNSFYLFRKFPYTASRLGFRFIFWTWNKRTLLR